MKAVLIVAAICLTIVLASRGGPQSEIEELQMQLAALQERIDDQRNAINAQGVALSDSADVAQANDVTLADWASQVQTDIQQLQVLILEQPVEISSLVGDLNDRLDDLAIYLNGGQNASVLLEGVDLTGLEDHCIGGCPAAQLLTTPPPTAPPEPGSTATGGSIPSELPVGISTEFGVDQWRPLVEAAFPPFGVEDALTVMRRESNGCQTAVAYQAGTCFDRFVSRAESGSTGCGARGLFQQCTGPGFWSERAVSAGLPHCAPIEMSVDATCNVFVSAWLWTHSGCSFHGHWPHTSAGTGRGCSR